MVRSSRELKMSPSQARLVRAPRTAEAALSTVGHWKRCRTDAKWWEPDCRTGHILGPTNKQTGPPGKKQIRGPIEAVHKRSRVHQLLNGGLDPP